jgi:drug/metabolite transporter (DMT)-like permease
MLAGLLIRRITWRGAAAGIITGFISGLTFFLYKNLVLAKHPGIDPNWLRYNYEAISILSNFGITVLVIAITTALEKVTDRDRAKIDEFFERLDTPIDPSRTHAQTKGEVFSPFFIIGVVTAGAGLLLIAASAFQSAGAGRFINAGAGITLCLLGLGFYRLHGKFMRREISISQGAQSSVTASAQAKTEVIS